MNYYEKYLIWDDVQLLGLTFHDATKHRFNIRSYKDEVIRDAINKNLKKNDQIQFIIEKTASKILEILLKYNKRLLILMIMQVKEISYSGTRNMTTRFNIHSLTNLMLTIISNNSDKFSVEYKYIGNNKTKLKSILKDIEWVIELGYLMLYAITNEDYLFDCIDKYNISDILENLIYPHEYEAFYDNDYLKMENKKKPEEYKIKNQALKDYINKKQKTTKCFMDEWDDISNTHYGFAISSLNLLVQKEKKFSNNNKATLIESYHNSLEKDYGIENIENIFEFLCCNKKDSIKYNQESIHLMELHPVYMDNEEIVYSRSYLIDTLLLLTNLIRSGDTQFARYYNFPKDDIKKIEGHTNTYMESYALGVLIERLDENGYVVPKINYNNEIIPVADVKKIKEFELNKIDFDSDLFFADIKRKIIYNIDFKYSNAIVSLKLTWEKGGKRIPKYIDNLRKRQSVIVNNLEKVKEILKIENISEFSFKSALCMSRSNYYCYVKSKEWENVYYTNWFEIIENLNKGKELF